MVGETGRSLSIIGAVDEMVRLALVQCDAEFVKQKIIDESVDAKISVKLLMG